MINFSNPYVMFGAVLLLVVVVILAVYVGVQYAIKKGYPVEKIFESADKNIDAVKGTIDTVAKIVPIPQIALIDKVLEYADVAVNYMEKLYTTGKLEGEARKQGAKDYILNILNLAKVEVTPELEKVIDGAIEASVAVLPKTHPEVVEFPAPVVEEPIVTKEPKSEDQPVQD